MLFRHCAWLSIISALGASVMAWQPAAAMADMAADITQPATALMSGTVTVTTSEAGTLRGTLLAATAPEAPLVIIIPGSGPTDQNGNGPLISTNTYLFLAEDLQNAGISVLRIDKRGMFSSASTGIDANVVSLESYGRDMRAWINEMAPQTASNCVWLAGHSEGGLVAMATAADSSAGICGLILLASPGRRTSDVLRQQLRANPANAIVLEDALGAIARLEQGQRVDVSGMHPALQGLFAPSVQAFLSSLFQFDAVAALQKHSLPVLIVQGREDLQVTLEDAAVLGSARPDATRLDLDGVTHTLKAIQPGDMAANQETYSNPALPIPPTLVSGVAGFIARH
jgi:uncharacterized protein